MMVASGTTSDLTIDIAKEIRIETPIQRAYDALLDQLGVQGPADDEMKFRFEPRPGGRWFRDLGDDAGHLWGHVQVIKPPTLIEITGPMFMSLPVTNHIQYRFIETDGATMLHLTHRAFGLIDPEHKKGVDMGWTHMLEDVRTRAES